MTDYTTLEHDAHRAVGIKRLDGCPVCDTLRGNQRKGHKYPRSRLADLDDLGDESSNRKRLRRLRMYKERRKCRQKGAGT